MKKGFGVIELIFVVIVAIVIYFLCYKGQSGRSNPFEEVRNTRTKQEVVESKLQQLEKTKNLKRQIEMNLKDGN